AWGSNDFLFGQMGSIFIAGLSETNGGAPSIRQVYASHAPSSASLSSVVGWFSQEKWFAMPTPTVLNGDCLASLDADAHLCGGMVCVCTSLCQNVNYKLADGDCAMNASAFRVVWFGHNGM
ncbi:MAG TPA: hypothetical protein VHY56_06970, partial [Candidatus Binataceae bacterium]|nr:hypothetical protein [Candidatus Binataceae bacterium]